MSCCEIKVLNRQLSLQRRELRGDGAVDLFSVDFEDEATDDTGVGLERSVDVVGRNSGVFELEGYEVNETLFLLVGQLCCCRDFSSPDVFLLLVERLEDEQY